MISRHTPPGTKVVCIDAAGTSDLIEGAEYTVSGVEDYFWTSHLLGPGTYVVWLIEVPPDLCTYGVHPRRFRRAALPSCLTGLLTSRPIKERADA